MSQRDIIDKLIVELHLTLTRPAMFMGETTIRGTQIYLSGMYSVLVLIGIVFTSDIRVKAVESRGWEFYANTGLYLYLQEQGLSEEQIVQELLLIEIKMLELAAEGLAD